MIQQLFSKSALLFLSVLQITSEGQWRESIFRGLRCQFPISSELKPMWALSRRAKHQISPESPVVVIYFRKIHFSSTPASPKVNATSRQASTVVPVPDSPAVWSPKNPMAPLFRARSEEHTSELQSRGHLVCRL